MADPKIQSMQLPRMSDQTRDLWEQLAGKVQGPTLGGVDFLSKLASGDQGQFQQLEAPALRQFGQFQGDIASRFSGAGSGARRSSGFQNVMGGAGADLAERLASNRMGLQQGAIDQLMRLYSQLMENDPYQQFHYMKEKKPSWAERLGGAFKGGIEGLSTGSTFGAPGAGVGAGLGFIGGLFS